MAASLNLRGLIITLLLIAIFLPRLASLGQIITVDEGLWQGRGEQFIKAIASGHFEKTLISGQPGVTTNWLIGVSYPWKSLSAAETVIALATSLLILLITYSLTLLWEFRWGVLGGFLLALDPFLIAHSRVAHTDALFSLLLLASCIFLLLFLEKSAPAAVPKRYLVISGILFAASLLTRSTGIILAPVLATVLMGAFVRRGAWHKGFEALCLWGAAALLTIFALWPALWVNPAGVAQYLTERTALHVSEGTHAGETTARWWYYLRDGFFRTTPVVVVALIPALFAAVKKRDSLQRTTMLLLTAGVFLAVVLSFSTDKSDRYILFSLLTLDLFAVLGLRTITHWLERSQVNFDALVRGTGINNFSPVKQDEQRMKNERQNYAGLRSLVVPTLAILYLAIEAFALHPYYLAHYNRFYPVESHHKLGWGEGLEQAGQWLTENANGAKIASYYPSVMKAWYSGPIDPLNHIDDSNAQYVVLYRSMFERGPDHIDTEIAARYLDDPKREPVHIVFINRLPYVWIYER